MAGTTADKLALLENTKEGLKAALAEKGIVASDVFSDYPDMVRAIQGGGVDTCTLVGEIIDPNITLYIPVVDETGAMTIQTIPGIDFDTVENVVCNNLLVVDSPSRYLTNYSFSVLASVASTSYYDGQQMFVYQVLTEPGDTGKVQLIIMD